MTCSGNGILSIGNMNPDNKIVGSINPIKEIIIAVCCVADKVEIKIPKLSEVIMNRMLSKANQNKLPTIGMLKINTLSKTLDNNAGPALLYCKSGTRAAIIWALSNILNSDEDVNIISKKVADAGYNPDALPTLVEHFR